MRVIIFGSTCSPSCAQFVKNQNAQRFQHQFPRAVEAIVDEHYVDDMLSSVESEAEAIELAENVRFIHAQAGFEIRHWLSNSQHVQATLDTGSNAQKSLNIGNPLATEKILGMWWCTTTDTFTFNVSPRIDRTLLSDETVPTKRQVLRTLMMVYDPLGLIGNFLMYLKILLQEIWRTGVAWDDPIREEQSRKWRIWLDVLPAVATVSVPRCYRSIVPVSKNTLIQLHMFVDASENGFAAVAYLRFQYKNCIECALVGSKTRVAPLRFVSIPKLELQAAVLGAHLASSIEEPHKLKPVQRFFWTDSRDVICWIYSDHRRYSQYVAFRVCELLESTEISEWNWISTKLNVADEATKWQKVPSLEPSSRWFRGPAFLWKAEKDWPMSNTNFGITSEELRVSSLHHFIREPALKFEYFSSWGQLVQRIAYVRRFPLNVRKRLLNQPKMIGPLTYEELVAAEKVIYRLVQLQCFSEEISILNRTEGQSDKIARSIPKNSPLYKLSPMLDTNGILRIHGRIDECEYADEYTKRPILLPKTTYLLPV
ncbi:uncharacterized protein LOC131428643 [Malaya genurostris]|uniref:uncharacterized protein LOC131428643 n=1 Tax=Malaya genurostris TaxID=325434 RepID=UPI0026F3994C|nr:uncharacterized protein LOC131428643 [Malaya genurostris]